MQDTSKRATLIAGLSVLVLGAGSYFLFAGGSEPVSPDAIAQASTQQDGEEEKPAPPGKVRPPRPPREKAEPRKVRKPREPRTEPQGHRRDRPKPKPPPKKRNYRCG